MKPLKLRIARWIYHHLADEWGGDYCPPGIGAKLDFGGPDDDGRPMLVARTHPDDGATIWLGYRRKWMLSFGSRDARRLAWMILWTWWAKGTWFGLKRRIWYKSWDAVMDGK